MRLAAYCLFLGITVSALSLGGCASVIKATAPESEAALALKPTQDQALVYVMKKTPILNMAGH
jgi:uncharacterized protein YceK